MPITDEQRLRAKARIAAKEFVNIVRGSNMAHKIPDLVIDSMTDAQLEIFQDYLRLHRLVKRPDWLWEEVR